jgi:hypothetical protein
MLSALSAPEVPLPSLPHPVMLAPAKHLDPRPLELLGRHQLRGAATWLNP